MAKEDPSDCDSEAQYLSNEQVWFMLNALEDEDSSSPNSNNNLETKRDTVMQKVSNECEGDQQNKTE